MNDPIPSEKEIMEMSGAAAADYLYKAMKRMAGRTPEIVNRLTALGVSVADLIMLYHGRTAFKCMSKDHLIPFDCVLLAKTYEFNERLKTSIREDSWAILSTANPQWSPKLRSAIKAFNILVSNFGVSAEQRNVIVHGSHDYCELHELRMHIDSESTDEAICMLEPTLNMIQTAILHVTKTLSADLLPPPKS